MQLGVVGYVHRAARGRTTRAARLCFNCSEYDDNVVLRPARGGPRRRALHRHARRHRCTHLQLAGGHEMPAPRHSMLRVLSHMELVLTPPWCSVAGVARGMAAHSPQARVRPTVPWCGLARHYAAGVVPAQERSHGLIGTERGRLPRRVPIRRETALVSSRTLATSSAPVAFRGGERLGSGSGDAGGDYDLDYAGQDGAPPGGADSRGPMSRTLPFRSAALAASAAQPGAWGTLRAAARRAAPPQATS